MPTTAPASPSSPSLEELKQRYQPQRAQVIEPDCQLTQARYSPCGRYLIGTGFDGLVHRWDFAAERDTVFPMDPLRGHRGWVQAMTFADDERLVTGDSWGNLRAWNYIDGTLLWNVEAAHDGWIRSLALSSDGRTLASCGIDRQVYLWDSATGRRQRQLSGHEHPVYSVTFHPQQPIVVSGDLFGVVKQWNLNTGKCSGQFDASILYTEHRLQDVGGARCMKFDPSGKILAVGGTEPKNGANVQGTPTLLLFDAASRERKQKLSFGKTSDVYVFDFLFHADGLLMVATCGGPGIGKILFCRSEDGETVYETKVANCHSISFRPDGRQFAVAATNTGSNGNGRRLDKFGNYVGNHSPVHIFRFADGEEETG